MPSIIPSSASSEHRATSGGRPRRLAAFTIAAVLCVYGFGSAAAHGAFIRGSVTLSPDPPVAGKQMVLTVDLARANGTPVEGAKLNADLKKTAPAGATAATGQPRSIPLEEYKEPYGTYRAQFTAPPAGSYDLTVHDRTQAGEDTTASVPLRIGGNVANGDLGFTFPAAGGTTHPVTRWLLWLVAIPVVAGVVVTVLVRRSNADEEPTDREED